MTWPVEAAGWDVEQAWVQSAADSLAWGILGWGLGVTVLLCVASWVVGVRRRSFRCEFADRHVEVEFEECGLPGSRGPVAVISCSAFDPPTAVVCDRSCLGSDTRSHLGGAS